MRLSQIRPASRGARVLPPQIGSDGQTGMLAGKPGRTGRLMASSGASRPETQLSLCLVGLSLCQR